MDSVFVRERITSLRMKKGVSEYQMSYDLGHSRGYINNISSGKSLPSVAELLSICDYFGITPAEFLPRTTRIRGSAASLQSSYRGWTVPTAF